MNETEDLFIDDEQPAEPINNVIVEHPIEPKEEPTTKVIKPNNSIMSHIKNLSKDLIGHITGYMPGAASTIIPITGDRTINDIRLQ